MIGGITWYVVRPRRDISALDTAKTMTPSLLLIINQDFTSNYAYTRLLPLACKTKMPLEWKPKEEKKEKKPVKPKPSPPANDDHNAGSSSSQKEKAQPWFKDRLGIGERQT